MNTTTLAPAVYCDNCESEIKEESFFEKINSKEMCLCDVCYYGCSWSPPLSSKIKVKKLNEVK